MQSVFHINNIVSVIDTEQLNLLNSQTRLNVMVADLSEKKYQYIQF